MEEISATSVKLSELAGLLKMKLSEKEDLEEGGRIKKTGAIVK